MRSIHRILGLVAVSFLAACGGGGGGGGSIGNGSDATPTALLTEGNAGDVAAATLASVRGLLFPLK